MPNDRVLGAGAATAVWAAWTAIELGFRRHRAIPSRDWDQGSLLALKVAHGFRSSVSTIIITVAALMNPTTTAPTLRTTQRMASSYLLRA